MSTNVERVFESLFIELATSSNKKIIIGEIYRSPSVSTKQFMVILENVLGKVLYEKAEIILMGDFNVDMMDMSSSQACDILALVISSRLTACVNILTRISNKSATLIDNVFSSIHSVKSEMHYQKQRIISQ